MNETAEYAQAFPVSDISTGTKTNQNTGHFLAGDGLLQHQ